MFAYLCSFFISKNKNRMYIENKMSEIDDFCEISVRIARAIEIDFQRSVDCFYAEGERDFLHSIFSSVCFLSMCSRFI